MGNITVLGSLFLTAFVAATFFPAQSEALLAGLILTSSIPVWGLVLTASIGNILGACVNWLLGRSIEYFKDRAWFPVKEKALRRAQERYTAHGRWILLLSWVPVIGDPITIVAGVMREKFHVFLLLVTVAKTGRYIVLAMLTAKIAHGTS